MSGFLVSIGTTSTQAGTRLLVAGGYFDVWSSANTLLRLNHDGTRGIIETFTGGAYSNTAINPNGGNVGIGTTSPFNKVTIHTGTNNNFDFFDNGTGVGLQSVNDVNTAYRPFALLGSSLSFTGAATFSSTVTTSGNITANSSTIYAGSNNTTRIQMNSDTLEGYYGSNRYWSIGRDGWSSGLASIALGGGTSTYAMIGATANGGTMYFGLNNTIGAGSATTYLNTTAFYTIQLRVGSGESQFWYGTYSDPGPGTAYDAKFGGNGGGGIAVRGNSVFLGSVSKGGGSFRIDHPLPAKKDTHFLLHSFIEGPTPDLIYRGIVNLVNGTATINIDEVSDMTEGTFVLLNKRVQCFTTNESGWDLTKGKVEGNILTITSQNSESTEEISWMVVGERQDEWMKNSDMTDEDGKIIVEKLKPTIVT